MTTDSRATQSGAAVYELTVSGVVGPVGRSCFPGFSSRISTRHTVLTGTSAEPADLQRVLAILACRGCLVSVLYLD